MGDHWPIVAPPRWFDRLRRADPREVINAFFYMLASGYQRRTLPLRLSAASRPALGDLVLLPGGHLDRIEVGIVGRWETQFSTCCLDRSRR